MECNLDDRGRCDEQVNSTMQDISHLGMYIYMLCIEQRVIRADYTFRDKRYRSMCLSAGHRYIKIVTLSKLFASYSFMVGNVRTKRSQPKHSALTTNSYPNN